MKLFVLIAILCANFHELFPQDGKIIIQVDGVNPKKGGELSIGFFNKENFPKVGKQLFGATREVSSTIMEIVFEKVPVGKYGIAVFQDLDRNKQLKTNFIGFPTEPIGFSNDVKIRFGPPSFDDAMILIENGKTLNLTIHLK